MSNFLLNLPVSYPYRSFIPVKYSSILISLFPPEDITASYFPVLALYKNFNNSKYLFFPFMLTIMTSSITLVKDVMPLLLGSKANVIFACGNSFFKDIKVGKKNISSPIPPKFTVNIFFILTL